MLWERPSGDIDWESAEEIGSGAFGRVYKIKLGDQTLAAKCIMVAAPAARAKAQEIMRREVRLLAQVRHPNVISLIGVCVDVPERTCLLLECALKHMRTAYVRTAYVEA